MHNWISANIMSLTLAKWCDIFHFYFCPSQAYSKFLVQKSFSSFIVPWKLFRRLSGFSKNTCFDWDIRLNFKKVESGHPQTEERNKDLRKSNYFKLAEFTLKKSFLHICNLHINHLMELTPT